MNVDFNKKAVNEIKIALNRFDPDFDDPIHFMKNVINAIYPKKKSPRAAKILREFEDCM